MGMNISTNVDDDSLGTTLSEINVTPFVDVMLVLLVIFMVTAPLMQQGLNVELPKAAAGALTHNDNQLTLTIDQNGRIELADQTISLKNLQIKLRAIRKSNPDAEIYLAADRRVRYAAVVAVIATVKQAGIARLGMVTDPPEALTEAMSRRGR